jgi:glycosyltransferase involved in cell wall biosynthesis
MVMIEALACGTPIIGLASGAIPEVIQHKVNGLLVHRHDTVYTLADAIADRIDINRADCRADFEARFTAERMCRDHLAVYQTLVSNIKRS